MNKYYLLSLKPKYSILLYITFIMLISVIISLFIFKTYDVYKTKGYLSCDDKCYITITVDLLDVYKFNDISYIMIGKDKINIKDKEVSEILNDEVNKSNYQIIKYEVDSLNNLNTFQDVKLYSNYETIYTKIIKYIF